MDATQSSLLLIGCVSIIAGIVGGNLKLPNTQFGKLDSPSLRLILAGVGAIIVIISFALPALTRSHPLKASYLSQLEAACVKAGLASIQQEAAAKQMAAARGIPLSADEYIATLVPFRQFSAEWHRWIAPEGDEQKVRELQDKFDHAIDALEDFYSTSFTPGMRTAETIKRAMENAAKSFSDNSIAMRNYGSYQCGGESNMNFSFFH